MMNKKQVYPSKTTLNLVMKERSSNYVPKMFLSVLLAVVLIGVFCKFLVIDRLSAANRIWDEVDTEQATYDKLAKSNADFETIRAEYEKYFSSSSLDASYVDVQEVMSIIDSKLMPSAGVHSVNLSGTKLSVILTGISLSETSNIYKSLMDSPIVETVTIHTADAVKSASSSVSMVIDLKTEGGAEQ